MIETDPVVILIHGVGQPLADAIARRLAGPEVRLALLGLPEDAAGLEATAAELVADVVLECDPADPAAVKSAVRQVVTELGGLDVLVNATVHRDNAAACSLSDAQWQRVIGVELSGTLYFCREAIRVMMRKRRGRIVNVTDVSGLRGEAESANHSSARGGVAALTRALASEVAPQGIYVNALGVSTLDEELAALPEASSKRLIENTPLGRAASAAEVAEAAAFLASAAASFTTGHVLQVNGGLYL